MFTGLIQAKSAVERLEDDGAGGRRLTLRIPAFAADAKLGESIAINGCCLTVVHSTAETLEFQIGPETVLVTTFGHANFNEVNLERALRVGDALGGHFVSGHIDCVGTVAARSNSGEWERLRFSFPNKFDDLLVTKGSIAVDGVSLTLASVEPGFFEVMLIPHTLQETTLGQLAPGDRVNLEFDLLAKHVKKLIKNLTITV